MELVLPRTRSYSSTGLVPYGHLSCWELYELVLGKTQFHDIEFLEKIHSICIPFFTIFMKDNIFWIGQYFCTWTKKRKKNWPDMLGNHSCCNQPRIHHNGIHWRVPYKHIGHRQHNFLLRTHPCYIDKLKNRQFCGLLLHRMQKWIEERSLEEFLDHEFHFLM